MGHMKGCVQVYTGTGKGKTTAALGLALRASGHGMKTYVAQFMKGRESGELRALRGHASIRIVQYEPVAGPGRKP
jgi:cob(I)alamin adenosyltransferase